MLATSQNDKMAITPLLAKLSMSVTSIVDLFDAVRCSMSWQFGEEKSRCLKAVLLRSSTEAIVFVSNSSVAQKMSSDSIIHLSGPLTASFTDGSNLLTEFIRIEWLQGAQANYIFRDIVGLLRGPDNPPGFQHCTFFCGDNQLIVGLQSSSQAESLQKKLSALSGVQSSNVVATSDHTIVEMSWHPFRSSTPLSEVLTRLTRTNHTLLGTLQTIVCTGDMQPCIIGATLLPSLGQSSHPDLAVICCTPGDASLIRGRVEIPLGTAGTLLVLGATAPGSHHPKSANMTSAISPLAAPHVPPTATSSLPSLLGAHRTQGSAASALAPPGAGTCVTEVTISTSSLPRSDVLYVFWDMQACPLFTVPGGYMEDKASVVIDNLETLLRYAMPAREGLQLQGTDRSAGKVCKVVILPGDVSSADSDPSPGRIDKEMLSGCCSAQQLSYLEDLHFSIITCDSTNDPENSQPPYDFSMPAGSSGGLSMSSVVVPTATSQRLEKELNEVLARHADDAVKPALCLLTSGALFTSLCDALKKTGFYNALLILNTMERKASSPSSTFNLRHLPWEAVRHFHELSERERKVVSNFSGDYNGIERLRKCKTKECELITHSASSSIASGDDAISSVSTGLSTSSGFGTPHLTQTRARVPSSVAITTPSPIADTSSPFPYLMAFEGGSRAIPKPAAAACIEPTAATTGVVRTPSASPFPYSTSVKVSRFSMAAHVSNLIKWRDEESAIGYVPPDGTRPIGEIFASCEDIHAARGEGKDNKEGRVQIEVIIDRDKRRQRIELRGETADAVKHKAEQVEQLLSRMNASRRVLRMYGWKAQHREAMMGSIPLNQMAQQCRASVVFHSTDGYIVSEMMALDDECIDQMIAYLKSLRPVEATWTFDSRYLVPEPRMRFWNSIRNRYGVMFEKKQRKNKLEVTAWGFGDLLDEAYEDVLAASRGNPVSYSSNTGSGSGSGSGVGSGGGGSSVGSGRGGPGVLNSVPLLLPAPPAHSSHTGPSATSQSNSSTLARHPTAPCAGASSGTSTICSRRYGFTDQEAKAFFLAFDEMFEQFMKHNFQVLVTPVSSMKDSDAGMLDLRGKNDRALQSAVVYLDRLGTLLNCYELSAVSVSEQRYRQILDLQEEASHAFALDAARVSTPKENPMECPGLISIRVKPVPHHAGTSRMIFPLHLVGVYLCESKSTAKLHGSDHRPSPKMQRIYQRFATLLDTANTTMRATSEQDKMHVGRSTRNMWTGGDGVWERKSADDYSLSGGVSGEREDKQDLKTPLHEVKYPGYVIEPPVSSSSSSNDDDFHGGSSTAISADVLQWLSSISAMSPTSHHTEERPGLYHPFEDDTPSAGDHFDRIDHDRRGMRAMSFGSSLSMSSIATESSGFPTPSRPHDPPSHLFSQPPHTTSTPTPTRKTYTEVLKGAGPSAPRGPPATARYSDDRSWRSDIISADNDTHPSDRRAVTDDTEGANSCSGSSVSGASGMGRSVLVPSHSRAKSTHRATVHWPHASFRYMFLAESMKTYIIETIARIRTLPGGEGVSVTCPYRDKKDPSACMLLEGPDKDAVCTALRQFDDMLKRVMALVRSEKIVLGSGQYQQLTSGDLGKVKAIQGSSGVHIILSPSPSDMQSVTVSHDLCQTKQRSVHASLPPCVPTDDEKLLIRMPVNTSRSVHNKPQALGVECLEMAVMTTPVEAQGWTWGVDALLAVVDSRNDDSADAFSLAESEQLLRGEVVATRDTSANKIVLRTRPVFSGGTQLRGGSAEEVEDLLAHVLQRGLREADRLGAVGLAIVPPDTVSDFTGGQASTRSCLTAQQVQRLTVSCVVNFARSHSLRTLRRIVLLDVLRDNSTSGSGGSSVASGGSSGSGVGNSLMAEYLCHALLSHTTSSTHGPAPTVVKCNDAVCRVFLTSEGTAGGSSTGGGSNKTVSSVQKGVHVLVMKGTKECLAKALEEIKDSI